MSATESLTSLTLRLEPELKMAFAAAVHNEDKRVGQVLRNLMRAYVEERKRKSFEAEAHRQSIEIARLGRDPNNDEYAVLREIEAEFDRDDFAGEWRA